MRCGVSSAWASYTAWVRTNPQLVSDSESVLKWCSYLLSGAQYPAHGIMGRRFPDGGLLRYRK